jgi:hypothetical protein
MICVRLEWNHQMPSYESSARLSGHPGVSERNQVEWNQIKPRKIKWNEIKANQINQWIMWYYESEIVSRERHICFSFRRIKLQHLWMIANESHKHKARLKNIRFLFISSRKTSFWTHHQPNIRNYRLLLICCGQNSHPISDQLTINRFWSRHEAKFNRNQLKHIVLSCVIFRNIVSYRVIIEYPEFEMNDE